MLKKVIMAVFLCLALLGVAWYLQSQKPKNVLIFEQYYDIDIENLDLANVDINTDKAWYKKLSKFNNLHTVNLGDNKVYSTTKTKLEKLYPDINFQVLQTYKIYDMEIREDATSIDFSKSVLDEYVGKYLGYFPLLEEVTFGNNVIATEIQLELKEKYPNIKFNWQVLLNGTYYDSSIISLDLSDAVISNYEEFAKVLGLFNNLQALDMSNSNLTNEELGGLREMYPNTEINWVVHFGRWSMRTDAIAFSVLIVDFSHTRLTSEDIEVLKYCTKLQALDLGHQAISDLSVFGKYLKELRVLILADNNITDITPLKELKHLHYLELFMNKITDISVLDELPDLVDLNLCLNYRLSDISSLMKLNKLERLWITKTSISNASVNNLKGVNPDINIVTIGEKSTDSGWRTHPRYYALIDMFHKNYISEDFTKYD